jgi:hypothetical protein
MLSWIVRMLTYLSREHTIICSPALTVAQAMKTAAYQVLMQRVFRHPIKEVVLVARMKAIIHTWMPKRTILM